jgi:3-deoxy-D-manno-octulosonic-acid transferase
MGLTRLAPALPRHLAARAHRRMGAAPGRLAERMGQASLARPQGRVIWVHAASVGEVVAVRDLALDLAREAGASLLFTTSTEGGAGAVPTGALHQFAPVDTPEAVRGFLDHWRPEVGIFVEADLWPRLVVAAGARGVKLALVNARASRTRTRAPRSMAALLGHFAVVTAQDAGVAEGLRGLGVAAEAVGDLRAAAEAPWVDPEELETLGAATAGRPVWAAVSTHPADEGAVAAAHRRALAAHPGALLLWAPRHPARAGQILGALDGLRVVQRSLGGWPGPGADVLLVDTLGETGLVFRLAPLTYLGGGLGPEGGHNPWEPARLGSAVLSGPGVANHRDGFRQLVAAGAARIVDSEGALAEAVVGLLGSAELEGMRAAAGRVAAEGSGARARTLEILRPLLGGAG